MEQIPFLYDLFCQSSGMTTDTRQCGEGMMFFALKGERFDGNAYALQALEKGCSCAVIDDARYLSDDKRLVLVDDVLTSLQQLARYHRRELGTPIIGITGTNGKTTTKELVAAVLSRTLRTHYTHGNLNNQIGVPLTLLQLTSSHQMAVVEMGASHPGDIRELVEIAEPDFGIITNVGRAHLQGFGSFEGVIRTKGELYDFLRTRPSGTIFLNDGDEHLRSIAEGLKAIRYGKASSPSTSLDVRGELIACDPYLRFRWQAADDADWHEVSTRLVGGYNIDNALCAIAVGCHFGVPVADICDAIESYTPSNSRSQLVQTGANTLVVDAYNANPTSMRTALLNFSQMTGSHKMVIAGDMRELGEASATEHDTIVQLLASCGFEQVWLVGDNFCQALKNFRDKTSDKPASSVPSDDTMGNSPVFRTFSCVEDVLAQLQQTSLNGMTILIKGSNSMRLASLVPAL
ncbi:MAG: UDP-N-acetylmuramoyl-tripeptide--D-alanyl-D-alanine ligase [Bacteroidaceae bacterium]|nr:UDP-N-acetylmuramoyl-tripeptide--D-alanyl-D-alanine ligase [Bacteroidaceae bacterium]